MPRVDGARRVALIAHERNLPYELVLVRAFYIFKPVVCNVLTFDESRAIGKCVTALSPEKGAKLAPPPSDPEAFARFEEAASSEYSNLEAITLKVGYGLLIKKYKDLSGPDQALVNKYFEELKSTMSGYKLILAECKFLAGDNIALADLFYLNGYAFQKVQHLGVDWASHGPNVVRWWKEPSVLESWQAVRTQLNSTV
ncbi:hypothetical protein BOTBODRAFT_176667 [Botryobasidium botryosum FD-172 SS1]|uniref:glutathione transferase n=1 Tax=Botryobasidium botryosum (strain FD-172 SS1) TaxID=930990 RepID=A0A067MJT3_BOTB1|nr:hypothetical protein BOTBODRAFT_176667 [Botryobasidium botryosum FD-172 SS1]